MTRKELRSDVMLGLAQYSDDFNVPERQVEHWLSMARNHIMAQADVDEYDKNIIKRKICLQVTTDSLCGVGCRGFVVDLPYEMTDIVVFRENGKSTDMEMATSQGQFDILCESRFSTGVIWWRCGQKIYFSANIPSDFKVLIEHLPARIQDYDDDQCVAIPSQALSISEEAKRIGLNQLRVPIDDSNEGRDDKGQ
jgi:hypothetical protein